MTLNQKIFAVSMLSVFVLILVIVGGVMLRKMVSYSNDSKNGTAPAAGSNQTSGQQSTPEVTGEAASEDNDQNQTDAEADESSEELADSKNAPWETYSNDFYTLEYPANYEISEKDKKNGDIDFQIGGFSGEAVSFISNGKKTLAFQGTWSVIAEDQATDQKLLDTETVDMNGIRFKKNYWAIRQIDDGNWLTAIVYYGCGQDQHCFSMLRGVTAKGISVWEEKNGNQLADKIKIKTLVNVMKASKETDTINFNNMFLTFRFAAKAAAAASAPDIAASKATNWKDCIFSPIVTASPGSTDRKLVCFGNDGAQKVVAESVKTAMGWGGLAEFYPNKVLFAPYSKEIYLTKYLSDSDSSSGIFALDVTTLESRRLANVGKIYENYYNYTSIISPNGKLIASLGGSDLYILDLAADTATVIATAAAGEILNPAGGLQDFKWIDDGNVQYPVYKSGDLNKVAEVRKASVK